MNKQETKPGATGSPTVAERLLRRLAEVATSLESTGQALALLGLGSVGVETSRLDEWSDLDFFAIVKPGQKARFIDRSDWLEGACGLEWLFRNTVDGYKLLWADGIFAEMAVFEPAELSGIPFAPGRVVWAADGFDAASLAPQNPAGRLGQPGSLAYLRGELLSCLYVGMCRYRRGEKLSAWRFIQGYCLDRFLEITELTRSPAAGLADPYVRDRRFEQRFPDAAAALPGLLAGYDATPRAAGFFLDFLESGDPVNPGMKRRILGMIEGSAASGA